MYNSVSILFHGSERYAAHLRLLSVIHALDHFDHYVTMVNILCLIAGYILCALLFLAISWNSRTRHSTTVLSNSSQQWGDCETMSTRWSNYYGHSELYSEIWNSGSCSRRTILRYPAFALMVWYCATMSTSSRVLTNSLLSWSNTASDSTTLCSTIRVLQSVGTPLCLLWYVWWCHSYCVGQNDRRSFFACWAKPYHSTTVWQTRYIH